MTMPHTASRPTPRAGRPRRLGLPMLGVLLIGANLRTAITSVGPLLDDLQHSLGLSSVGASVLISLPLVAFAVVSPFAPMLSRAWGLERTLGAALALLALGIPLRSTPSAVALWGGTALLGMAIALLNVLLPALVKRDFPGRIGQVTGTYSAVQSGFAALAAGTAVPVAGMTGAGWRLPLGMWGLLALVALVVFAPRLREHTRLPRTSDDLSFDEFRRPDPSGRNPWRTALGWQVTMFMGLQSVTFYVLVTWLASIERAAGVGATAAGVHQFLLNACAIAGSLACSALIPRFRDQQLLAGLLPCLMAIAVGGLLVAPRGAAAWDSLAGFSAGATIVLALSFFGLRTGHHTQAAALSGMAQSVGYLLAAAGPFVAGAVHDASGSWTPVLVILLGIELLLVCFGALAGRPRVIG